jgi:hypothetical protein
MARTKNQRNGRLEEAMTNLLQSQAALTQAHATLAQSQATLIQTQAEFTAEMAQLRRGFAETNRINDQRFARIEAILSELVRILHALPDAIRDKIASRSLNRRRPKQLRLQQSSSVTTPPCARRERAGNC